MPEIVNLQNLQWLVSVPASDQNFTNALKEANLPTVEEAIRQLPKSAPKIQNLRPRPQAPRTQGQAMKTVLSIDHQHYLLPDGANVTQLLKILGASKRLRWIGGQGFEYAPDGGSPNLRVEVIEPKRIGKMKGKA
jgi:hypothetical protein